MENERSLTLIRELKEEVERTSVQLEHCQGKAQKAKEKKELICKENYSVRQELAFSTQQLEDEYTLKAIQLKEHYKRKKERWKMDIEDAREEARLAKHIKDHTNGQSAHQLEEKVKQLQDKLTIKQNTMYYIIYIYIYYIVMN